MADAVSVHRHGMHACARARAHARAHITHAHALPEQLEATEGGDGRVPSAQPLRVAPPQVGSEFRGVWNVGRGIMNVTHGAAEFPGAEDKVCLHGMCRACVGHEHGMCRACAMAYAGHVQGMRLPRHRIRQVHTVSTFGSKYGGAAAGTQWLGGRYKFMIPMPSIVVSARKPETPAEAKKPAEVKKPAEKKPKKSMA